MTGLFAVSTVCRTTVSVLYPVRTARLGASKLPRRVAYGGVNRALRRRTSVLITSVVFRMSIGADYCRYLDQRAITLSLQCRMFSAFVKVYTVSQASFFLCSRSCNDA